jgi:hypothetical protein
MVCEGHTPEDLLKVGFPNVEDCRAKCSADPSCQAFDYAPVVIYKWCVIVSDSQTCTLRAHGNWEYYQKN